MDFKGWKTLIVNILTAVVAITAWPQVVEMVDPQILLLISAAANIVLRYFTDSPMGRQPMDEAA